VPTIIAIWKTRGRAQLQVWWLLKQTSNYRHVWDVIVPHFIIKG
jgi:hypothetical protein